MKKIAIVCESLKMGGTEVALLALIKQLLAHGHSVVLYVISQEGPLLSSVPGEVVLKSIRFSNSLVKYLVGASCESGIKGFLQRVIRKLYKVVLQIGKIDLYTYVLNQAFSELQEYDAVLDAFGYGRFVTAYAARKLNGKTKITWFHDENMWWIDKTREYLDGFDYYACVSEAVKSEFDRRYPCGKNASVVIHNLIDCDRIKKMAKEETSIPYEEGITNLLTIGRLSEQKGIDLAIEVAEKLVSQGAAFKWYVIGDGEDRDKLQHMIDEKQLGDYFALLGMKINPYPFLLRCDVYVQPSRYEGYGLTILEARVLEKPIIATNLKCFAEQVKNGVTGILVDFERNLFVEAIMSVIDNKVLQSKLTTNLKSESIGFEKDYEVLENLM